MQKQKLKIIFLVFIVSCFSFFSGIKLAFAVNTSTADDDDKRILLEAAHGSGYTKNGWDECNHAKNSVNGKTYYENIEARIMIDKIAGYLKQANIPYEISNEVVGDAYFTNPNWQINRCNPEGGDCCGFRQGTIGNYSKTLYEKIDRIGSDKYLFAFELHFNGYDGKQTYSAVMVDSVVEPFKSNGEKIIGAVDKVIGTTGSMVSRDVDLVYDLTAINNLQTARNIPTYYLETFFMDYTPHLEVYLNKKDELAKELAQVLIEMAGSSERLDNISNNSDDDEEELVGGRNDDPFSSFPLLNSSENFTCRAIFVDRTTGELNDLGNLLQDIFDAIKIFAPVIAISLSVLDFIKALASNNSSDALKKALKRTFKRLIIGLILIFLPYLLDLLFHTFGLYDISSCGIE